MLRGSPAKKQAAPALVPPTVRRNKMERPCLPSFEETASRQCLLISFCLFFSIAIIQELRQESPSPPFFSTGTERSRDSSAAGKDSEIANFLVLISPHLPLGVLGNVRAPACRRRQKSKSLRFPMTAVEVSLLPEGASHQGPTRLVRMFGCLIPRDANAAGTKVNIASSDPVMTV